MIDFFFLRSGIPFIFQTFGVLYVTLCARYQQANLQMLTQETDKGIITDRFINISCSVSFNGQESEVYGVEVPELKDSRIDQCQSSVGNESQSGGKGWGDRKGLQALKSHIIKSSGWAMVVSNHEFFNVLSPNGPLCPRSALPGTLKIIEDLSRRKRRGE